MDDMKTVLITGATGLVGCRAYEYLHAKTPGNIVGTSRSSGTCVDLAADLTDISAVEELSSLCRPDAIIHTAAISRTDACEKNRELCYATNVATTRNLVEVFPETRFVYFSTYAVYDTPEGGCREECETRAANYYIQTKLLGEDCVQHLSNAVILRPSVIFGFLDHKQASKNYVMQLLDNIRQGKVTRSPREQYFNPVWVDVVVEILRRILDADVSGIYNVGSNESISKYAFNRLIMDRFELDPNFLEGIDSVSLDVKRPSMGTISSSKVQEELGYRVPPLTEMVNALYATSAGNVARYLAPRVT